MGAVNPERRLAESSPYLAMPFIRNAPRVPAQWGAGGSEQPERKALSSRGGTAQLGNEGAKYIHRVPMSQNKHGSQAQLPYSMHDQE